jgi:hypothetical protein
LDKLKHVPRCAARKLSAVSFQHSAFERHEIVAACKEYGGTVIQKLPRRAMGCNGKANTPQMAAMDAGKAKTPRICGKVFCKWNSGCS